MRYIIHKDALKFIDLDLYPAIETLGSEVVIKNEAIVYKNIPYISAVLTEEDLEILRKNNIFVKEEELKLGKLLGPDYEKVRSLYIKPQKRSQTGIGCKIAIMDSGLNVAVVPVEFTQNFADANIGVGGNSGHGTFVTSIIKSSEVGLAQGAEVHFLKVLTDAGVFNESAFLTAVDYCIDNNIDIVNMSFDYGATTFLASIQDLVTNNCVVSASSGNTSTSDSTISAPAGENNVVAVNAVKEDGSFQYRDIIPYQGGKGITVACSGVACEGVNNTGNVTTSNGTSFSSPFFVGLFAIYKEQLGISDNYKILNYILSRCKKDTQSAYFGQGLITF